MGLIFTLVAITAALALGIGLAYLPMRLLMATMAKNIVQFITRNRDRRTLDRPTPDRRKEPVPPVTSEGGQ